MHITTVNENEIPERVVRHENNQTTPEAIAEMARAAIEKLDSTEPGKVVKIVLNSHNDLFLFFKEVINQCNRSNRRDVEKFPRPGQLTVYLKKKVESEEF